MQRVIPRYFVVAESGHALQNPTSEEKIRRLGQVLRLGPDSTVLDIASGRGGPAIVLAAETGCTVSGIEISPDFHAVAIERAAAAGVSERVGFRLGDAAAQPLPEGPFDAALCLGASFVFGGLSGTLDVLEPVVRPGGHVVVGEPFWRRLPLPKDYGDRAYPFTTLEGTVTIFEAFGLPVVSALASSEDDWDRYETQHWDAVERWLAENPDDPEAADIRSRHERAKSVYLRQGRDYLGWAIFAGWKRPPG